MFRSYTENNDDKKTSFNDEIYVRREKVMRLREKGIAFPNDFRRNFLSNILRELYYNKSSKELKNLNVEVSVAGRMIRRRIMGKASFVTLQDMGGLIQLYVVYDGFSKDFYDEQFKKWDLGDIIGACGKLFKTRTGELSVFCKIIRLLTKSIRPLPDKFHGLINQETRYRQRYLDLIVNHKSRRIFKTRSLIMVEIRKFMTDHDFMEVETPMMHAVSGGAIARPFISYNNSLNTDMYLRISPELYLKRLVVGGFERVFEINRSFRNEGLSSLHYPEFTMMECYMAYVDYRDLMLLIEELLFSLVDRVSGSNAIKYGDHIFDFSKPFVTMTMKESICYYKSEIKLQDIEDINTAISIAESLGIIINNQWKLGKIQASIFEKIVIEHLIQPTFITDYPVEVSPLARRSDENPSFTDRFELFIGGHEIGNGFSELNDYEDQAVRFAEQLQMNIDKNNVGMSYDEDYIVALEHGLPPTAGVGIGIDRLIMLLTNSHTIRDVILFPTLRSQK